jgi:hypothetical protein
MGNIKRKITDLFYSKGRLKDRVIEIKQVVDLLLKELEKEEWDLYLIADYVLELSGHISVVSRWIRKIRLEEIEKDKSNNELGKGKVS